MTVFSTLGGGRHAHHPNLSETNKSVSSIRLPTSLNSTTGLFRTRDTRTATTLHLKPSLTPQTSLSTQYHPSQTSN
jgi:hypothetical protein